MRIAVLVSVVLTLACRQREGPDNSSEDSAGEPQEYSSTVVRIVDDGKRRETIVSREYRAGEHRREEWTEGGQNLALIWRPDTGKAFLLDPDRRVYVEIDIGAATFDQLRAAAGNPSDTSTIQRKAELDATDSTVQAIDQYFGDTQSPTRVETQRLSPASIDGRQCNVYQERATFPDGHIETTRRFHARDLSGLLLRVEIVAEQGAATVTTERQDVRLEVAPEAFTVPDDFKKVEKLPR